MTRARLTVGDRLVAPIVAGPNKGEEGVSAPITTIGAETVLLADGTIVPLPQGQAVYIERTVTHPFLSELEGEPEGA